MAEDGARGDAWSLDEHLSGDWAAGVSWDGQTPRAPQGDAEAERLERLHDVIERTRAKIEALCVLGDLVGERSAALVDTPDGLAALAELQQMHARLVVQFSEGAEAAERLFLGLADNRESASED